MSKFTTSLNKDSEYFVVYSEAMEEVKIKDPRNVNYKDYEMWVESDKHQVEKVSKAEIGKRLIGERNKVGELGLDIQFDTSNLNKQAEAIKKWLDKFPGGQG